MEIAAYLIREELYQGKHFSVYRAVKKKNSAPCVLKVLDKRTATSSGIINSIKNEYRLLKRIDSEFVIKALDLVDQKDHAVIVLEDINGIPLKDEITGNPLPLDRFIRLAAGIIDGLASIHRQNIIHRDINPTNIILDDATDNLKIIDFSIASKFDIKVSYAGNPEVLQGTLPYISPEQTGRMNSRVDYRSDLYSLGVTFYEMLTGQLPFQHHNPIEIVYAHLARDPKPPHKVNKQVPKILAGIILKLLAKNPEERYQSIEGLKHDLEKSRRLGMADFQLGEKDFSGKLQIPEKLYGRKNEIEQLSRAYRHVSKGARELILLAGYAGTGKSALVNEIHKPITRDRGYFISGKFDQLQRTIPYFAFIQALNQFCRLILTEKQVILDRWKERILQALGKLGKVLTDTIPQLESVIGVQPEVPTVGGVEAKKRFNHVFQCFLRVVSTREHPLVIFIDDLQWADLDSINLLQVLLEDKQNHYVLFIGAYRDNEVSPTHPLMTALEEIQKQDIAVHTIPVKNLSLPHVGEWLGDTLKTGNNTDSKDVVMLAGLIYQKTVGNAFFTIQFLENLHEHNLLRFDVKRYQWTWDLVEIEKQNITDNVVDLLVRKIQTLPPPAQEVLMLAACIGNVFDLHTLSLISQKEKEQQRVHLEISLIHHLVYPLEDENYKFVHDRIHQAAYSLISDEEKKSLHLKIGRLLLKNFRLSKAANAANVSKEAERRMFDIVNHLNIGVQLIETEKEKIQLARLNLETGQNAKMSAAYKMGADYMHTAIALLPAAGWQHDYDLSLAIYNEAVQTSYLCGNYEEMESFVETILTFAHNTADTSVAYEHRLRSLVAQNQPHRAVETVLTIFSSLGVDIPRKPGKLQSTLLLLKTRARLDPKGIESLKDLPLMDDPRKELVIKLFYMGGTALVWAGQDVFIYIIGTTIGFILKHGLTPESPYVLGVYAAKRVFLGDIPGAYRLAETIQGILDRGIGGEAIRVSVVTIMSIFILGNKQHFKKVCRLLMENYQQALNLGNFDYAGHILANYILFLGRTDMEVPLLHKKAEGIRDTIVQLKQSIMVSPIIVEMTFSENLLGKHPKPAVLDLDLDGLFEKFQEDTKKVFFCQANIKRIILAYLFDEYADILAYIKAVEDSWKHITSPLTFMTSDIHFYIPLAYLQLCTRTPANDRGKKYLNKARKSIKKMAELAEFGPVNFLHKYYLMQAEFYRVTGKSRQAAEYYEQAIEKAYENEYINEAALANELAAKFHIQSNQHKLAAIYLMEARGCYSKWGAIAKVKHLDETYPKYLSQPMSMPGSTRMTQTISSASTESSGDFLDVKSILKASQTLSGEVQLKGLLEKMMQILIENAGAQKSVLIQDDGERLLIQAEGDSDGVTGILRALPVEESGKVPLSVINYVARGKQISVFDNLSKDTHYSTDKYIQEHQPQSAVCVPILSKGELFAIIYLENNLVEGAFTPARLEILNMLSSQIAISVENTQLYEQLEEKVRQRTIALRQAHEQLEKNHEALEESHRKISDSVNYASRIQEAVLPTPEFLAKLLPQHFILYRPCSVVSGDFYWVKQVDHHIIAVAADCTGHGVPGALVSMLGMAFLNEIVPKLAVQSQLTAANILNSLRNEVIIALKQRGKLSEQKEGMDIALCVIDPINKQLQYAGAHNPLYITKDHQLVEVKADRMPIAISRKEQPFTNHDMSFQSGDMIYLFSDGYADQNRDHGEEEEKFTKKRLKRLLAKINQEPLPKQKEILTNRFEEWKGNLTQRDDVLIFGIRL
jgi:predicted ATPase/GAF domain-containing protein/tRNA A-37 threonylcarbamoyl transferase component Bud32